MNISYLRELLEHVDKQKMCDDLGMDIGYLNMILDLEEAIDSTRLVDVMNYLELDYDARVKLCTFTDVYDLCPFEINK